jgi:uncharacterized repeat protein (TIGR03837 family)
MTAIPRRWDIFCKVVDNFGDAGVAWRLARMLAAEHGLDVTLWLDQPAALARIAPDVVADRPLQRAHGVVIRPWADPFPAASPAEVVIEAFGCGVPDAYVAAMAACPSPPTWFVLEYLSGESWVEGTHGLASPHPRLPLARRFWFPGFTATTGGLLRERSLFGARDAFRADAAAQAGLWASLGVPVPAADETRISLFCYPNRMLPALLDAWTDGDRPVVCVVPEGVAAGALDLWAGGAVPHPGGAALARGRLRLHVVPFVAQDDYDRLLWACDINFVRGEDSFVRAQWAARPFVWHIYPQAGNAHLTKLRAFLDRYVVGLDPASGRAVRQFWRTWNGDADTGAVGAAWLEFAAHRPHLALHGSAWAMRLGALPDLADGLVRAAAASV